MYTVAYPRHSSVILYCADVGNCYTKADATGNKSEDTNVGKVS